MKTASILGIIAIFVCLGNIPAQQTTATGKVGKMDICEFITWKGNILHKICTEEKPVVKPAAKGLQKMINDAEHEVKNLQKTVAAVEQKVEQKIDHEKKGIFQYRKAAEGLIEGKHSIIIR